MLDNKISNTFFDFTSKVTTLFPKGGAWFFDHTLIPAVGNPLVRRLTGRYNRSILQSIHAFQRILVVSDIHIGDAILAAGGVAVFRDFFPEARIDYVIKNSVACLFEGNPAISNLYPVFTGGQFPNDSDLASVKKLSFENDYDLCLNCCPFIEDGEIFPPGQKVLNAVTFAPKALMNLTGKTGSCHFMYNTYDLPGEFLPKSRAGNQPALSRAFRSPSPTRLSTKPSCFSRKKASPKTKKYTSLTPIPPPPLTVSPLKASSSC